MKGMISLKEYEECECLLDEKKPSFRLGSSQKDARSFSFQTDSEADAKAWAQAINNCLKVRYHFHNPSIRTRATRKREKDERF